MLFCLPDPTCSWPSGSHACADQREVKATSVSPTACQFARRSPEHRGHHLSARRFDAVFLISCLTCCGKPIPARRLFC